MKKKSIIGAITCALLLGTGMTALGRDLDALQKEFLSWKFGMFIHFNMSTFVPGGWSTGKEDPLLFNPTEMDFGQWADAAKAAKMKYGILTVKHTGGWCLWDTATSDRDISWFKNYKDGKGDMVAEFAEAFRDRDLKVGLYYCFPLWGAGDKWKSCQTLASDEYAEGTLDALTMIKAHFSELLTNYGPIDLIWIDQSSSPHGGLKEGDWRKVKAHIHSLQPNCIVTANNQMDFADTDIFGYEYPYSLELPKVNNLYPTEVCDKLNQGWFSTPGSPAVPVRTADYLVNKMLRPLNDNHANLLLNCAPDTRGLMHEETVAVLKKIGEMWDPNEASHAEDELYGITMAPVKKVPTLGKQVALIFPPNWTISDMQQAAILLVAHQAHGTFFVNEARARTEKAALRKLVEAGHTLGNGSKSDAVITGKANARQVRNEIDPVQKQLHAVQAPIIYRAPAYQYDDYTWSVLNYMGLTAVESSSELEPGVFLEVKTLAELNPLLRELQEKGLEPVTATELFANSTSKRLQLSAASKGAAVVTGRE
jgi:alpha-L-fucosidase